MYLSTSHEYAIKSRQGRSFVTFTGFQVAQRSGLTNYSGRRRASAQTRMRRSKALAARGFVFPRTTGERAQWTVFSSTPRESAHQTQESWSGNKLRHRSGAPVRHADNPRPLFSAPNHASMNSRLNPPVCCMCRRVCDRLWVRGSWNDALWAAIAPLEPC